jgi:hypothetical protein
VYTGSAGVSMQLSGTGIVALSLILEQS